MKYREELMLELPRDSVVDLFDDPDNLSEWQPGLKSFDLISGEAGHPGAKSRLRYEMDGREIEMIETIEVRNLPEEFSGTYEAKGVWNRVVNRFHELDPDRTRWEIETEFKFSGLMRVMAFFMRGSFARQTRENMHAFKRFAEGEANSSPTTI